MPTLDRRGLPAVLSAVLLVLSAHPGAAAPRFGLEVEAGPVWQTRNDVQIPAAAPATRFSLVDAVGRGPWPAARVYLEWRFDDRRSLRALYAPLTITEDGALDAPVVFAGQSLAAGPVHATYRFDSYRLSYRQRFHADERWTWWWGFTAKIRDARVALERDGQRAVKDNTGFVPLLHVAGDWQPAPGWHVSLDADALAGGPGRAEDVAVKLGRDLSDRVRLAAGYRLVEGGADVDEAYAFAWLHYLVASARVAF